MNVLNNSKFSTAKIDRIFSPNKQVFEENYGYPLKPVILMDMMLNWRSLDTWNIYNLCHKFKDVDEIGFRNRSERKFYKMLDFYDYLNSNSDKIPFYLEDCQFHLDSNWVDEYAIPDFFISCTDLIEQPPLLKYALSKISIGPKRSFSHPKPNLFDTNSWTSLFQGKKLWLLYPSEQIKFLYDGIVNPFKYNPADFSLYKKFANPIIFIQRPGETVFVPSSWWYANYNIEDSLSLTENYINSTNHLRVIKFLRLHGKDREAELIESAMNLYFASFL